MTIHSAIANGTPKTTIIGCGRWASFHAWYAARLGHQVMMYGRPFSTRLQQLRDTHANAYLQLPESVSFTDQLSHAIDFADVIIIAIEAQQLRSLAEQLTTTQLFGKTLVLTMKGLETHTGLRLTQVLEQTRGVEAAVWVGPGHVQDFVAGIPNCMVMDAKLPDVSTWLMNRFASDLVRFYQGDDLIGTEVGAALKNVMGIAAGMLDGVGFTPLKGALMTRGTSEVARLIEAMGGAGRSAYGLCHLGDYQATLFSAHSHNRRYGEACVRQQAIQGLAEGVATSKTVQHLQSTLGIELPICEAVAAVLATPASAQQQLRALFSRPLTTEF
jgi:glycerol-3-phosphate dehydrogenase (NAD(P)+)